MTDFILEDGEALCQHGSRAAVVSARVTVVASILRQAAVRCKTILIQQSEFKNVFHEIKVVI